VMYLKVCALHQGQMQSMLSCCLGRYVVSYNIGEKATPVVGGLMAFDMAHHMRAWALCRAVAIAPAVVVLGSGKKSRVQPARVTWGEERCIESFWRPRSRWLVSLRGKPVGTVFLDWFVPQKVLGLLESRMTSDRVYAGDCLYEKLYHLNPQLAGAAFPNLAYAISESDRYRLRLNYTTSCLSGASCV